jgi:hypothetical protein
MKSSVSIMVSVFDFFPEPPAAAVGNTNELDLDTDTKDVKSTVLLFLGTYTGELIEQDISRVLPPSTGSSTEESFAKRSEKI